MGGGGRTRVELVGGSNGAERLDVREVGAAGRDVVEEEAGGDDGCEPVVAGPLVCVVGVWVVGGVVEGGELDRLDGITPVGEPPLEADELDGPVDCDGGVEVVGGALDDVDAPPSPIGARPEAAAAVPAVPLDDSCQGATSNAPTQTASAARSRLTRTQTS